MAARDGFTARDGFRARDGFTIVEILLAILLLSFVVMGFQAATGQIIHYTGQSDRETVALQLVEDRLERVRLDPAYELLEARYEAVDEEIAGFAGLERTTTIVRTVEAWPNGTLDYQRITVTVTGTGVEQPVARSIVVAAP